MSAFVVAVAAIAAIGPVRAARRTALATPAQQLVGAFVALALGSFFALIAQPLLDQLRISPPTMVIAAGLVLVAFCAGRIIDRRPVASVSLGPGWQPAVIPMSFPILLSPAIGVVTAGIAVHWDPIGAIVSLGLALAIFLVISRSEDLQRRWLSALLAAAGVVAGVDLIVEGIFSV